MGSVSLGQTFMQIDSEKHGDGVRESGPNIMQMDSGKISVSLVSSTKK